MSSKTAEKLTALIRSPTSSGDQTWKRKCASPISGVSSTGAAVAWGGKVSDRIFWIIVAASAGFGASTGSTGAKKMLDAEKLEGARKMVKEKGYIGLEMNQVMASAKLAFRAGSDERLAGNSRRSNRLRRRRCLGCLAEAIEDA